MQTYSKEPVAADNSRPLKLFVLVPCARALPDWRSARAPGLYYTVQQEDEGLQNVVAVIEEYQLIHQKIETDKQTAPSSALVKK